MTRTPIVALFALTFACTGKEEPEPFTPDTNDDDTEIVEDTDPPPTPTPPPGDTGTTFVAELVGQAEVNLNDGTVSGYQGVAFAWRDDEGVVGKPKCVQYSPFTDWASDEERDQLDPLRDKHPLCPDCVFSFTLSLRGQEDLGWLPWESAPPGYDPDGDGPQLSCAFLRTYEIAPKTVLLGPNDDELEDFVGYGFQPSEDDPNVGAWMVWSQNESIWAPYNYNATLSGGVFQWNSSIGTFYY